MRSLPFVIAASPDRASTDERCQASAKRFNRQQWSRARSAEENDLIPVHDEVQCGAARTGRLYAYEHYGIEPDEFLERVTRMGERLRGALEQMIPNHDHLFEGVRGLGLMLGVRMKTDSRAFVAYLRGQGLLTVAAGDNVMRVLPPLIVEDAHIAEFVEKLSEAARQYEVPQAA
jgi:acetylornithine/succinyldiaminopimelate/putrescine aminotransferase